MQHYNMGNYFQSAYLSRGDVTFASPYVAISKPLLITFENCNVRSIKPTHYNYGKVSLNIINIQINFKKGNRVVGWLFSHYPILNRIGIPREIIIINIYYTIKISVKYV